LLYQADLVRDQAEVLSFMYTNKIGERLALFWIAWAYVAEKEGNHKAADQIFQKGLRRLAEPKDILQKRYHQFQRRIARQFLNCSGTESRTEPEPPKKKRAGLQENSSIPVPEAVTKPLKPSGNQEQSKPAMGFAIFDESAGASSSASTEWKNLGKETERKKENQAPATKWNNAAFPSSAPSSISVPPAAAPFSIPIFVDDQFTQPPPPPPQPASTCTSTSSGLRMNTTVKTSSEPEKPKKSTSNG
jgi:hypothetical protein